ncbi:MAG: hypothetical protein KJ958_05480 [Gammaproteobacteria bacterium]|nr:hypothetical protein [Gammaproteobacteria bacterium]MBU1978605.1 hypothetical protein [Gammaproteobacteria bacterium]
MEKIPVTNNTAMPIYVGSSMVPAGETRHFDIDHVPLHLRPVAAEVEAPFALDNNALVALIGESVKNIIEAFPTLTLEELEQIGEIEQLGQNRKTLLSAIATEILKREGDSNLEFFLAGDDEAVIANLARLEEPALVRLAEIETAGQNREAVVSAISAEQIKRAG